MIAFFGMGLLGSNFVRALADRGERVNVWNRTHAKAAALETHPNVRAFEDPAEAVKGATRLHLTLSDDQAVDEVLERAFLGMPHHEEGSDTPPFTFAIIDHTTTTASGVVARMARWDARGIVYLHAPVFMGPQNARESTGLMLVSGDPGRVESVPPALEKMTGKLVWLGARPDAASAFKLLGNLFLMFMTTGMADMLALAKALDVPPAEAATLFDHFNPGATAGLRMKRMIDAKYSEPSWQLSMARKDARLVTEEAARAGVPLAIVPAIAARMDQVIAEGHGGDDWTVLAKDALTQKLHPRTPVTR